MLWLKALGLIKALFKGQILLNPESWKNKQLIADTLTTIFVAIFAFMPHLNVTNEMIMTASLAIAMLGGVVSLYLTAATTTKVGLPPKGKVYEYIQAKLPEPQTINHADIAITDNGVQFQPTDREMANVVPSKTEPNSVNSGGKGLLGR